MGIRVYELAKKLGLSSKELVEKLKKLNIEVKGPLASLDEHIAQRVETELGAKKEKKKKEEIKQEKGPVATPGGKEQTPRAEVSASEKKEIEKPSKTAEKVPAQRIFKPTASVKSTTRIAKPVVVPVQIPPKEKKKVFVRFPILVKDLAEKMEFSVSEIIKHLMKKGIMVNINQSLSEQTGTELLKDLGYEFELAPSKEQELLKIHSEKEQSENCVLRAPVVTFMGHVDHGKTSLLDYIRKSKVVEQESGGITQHIGAYEVVLPKGKVTFLDTPGHEAFTAMRARGANITDVVVIVVAADDGVMPQTLEAIDHAKAAGVTIVVAINKIDKPSANVERVKKQLSEIDLLPEDWGGKTVTVGVSAKTGVGVDVLLEMLLLEAELLELKANPHKPAKGTIVEAKLSKGSGSIATVLVQQGTLRIGDFVVTGLQYGRVRAMINDKGKRIKEAGPSTPVEILGLTGVPQSGESFFVVEDEKKAKELISEKQEMAREKDLGIGNKVMTLEGLYEQIRAGQLKELNIIVKADAQGSIEAIKEALKQLSSEEVKVSIIHAGSGDVTDADVMLACASKGIIIGFHVGISPQAAVRAKEEKVDVRFYQIIYQITSDVHAAMEGLLEPYEEEVILGKAKVLQVFKVSKAGTIAGCKVLKGKIIRSGFARVLRAGEEVYKGKISSLKRFKDDAKEVLEGFECGLTVGDFSGYAPDDIIEGYQIEKKARRLSTRKIQS